jgi:hypothetical protein
MKVWNHKIVFLAVLLCLGASCTRVMVIASDHATDPVVRRYTGGPDLLFTRSLKILETMGYDTPITDNVQFKITTGWKPVGSSTHYLTIFNSKDYGASDGAYYQMQLSVVPEGAYSRVEVRTNVKSVAGKLSSANVLEKAFLERLDDASRSPQIQVTNVGVTNR